MRLRARDRAICRGYYDGVIDATSGWSAMPYCGLSEGSHGREYDSARRQGWYDARDQRVLRRHEFSAETVLVRIEVRSTQRKDAAR